MKKHAMLMALGLVLAGCQSLEPIQMTVNVTPTNPAVTNGDVLAERRAAGEDIPELRGFGLVTVRTFHMAQKSDGSGIAKKEFTSIPCTIESEGYSAQIKTPAEIQVPQYGYASRPVLVKCVAPDYKDGFRNITPYDVDKAGRRSAGAGNGIAGMLVMEIINSGDEGKENKFAYPPVNVMMNRVGCENLPYGCKS